MPQMLDLAGKDFKAAIINMSKILMEKRFKKLKENMIWMSKQRGNVNREKEPRRNSWTKKQNNEIKKFKDKFKFKSILEMEEESVNLKTDQQKLSNRE